MQTNSFKIVVDSREQKPLPFRKSKLVTEVITRKLDAGDYSIDGYDNKIAIERKSIPDLYGTLGKGHKRFQRELERAKDMKYFAILVDGTFTAVKNKDFDYSHRVT